MTLEIYSYLLIRNVLISFDSKTINENIRTHEEYTNIIKGLSELMKYEDFALVSSNLSDKILDIVQYHRFKFDNKEILDDINNIIQKINQYRTMDINKKIDLLTEFYEKESKKRNLPAKYANSVPLINSLIEDDIYTYKAIFKCYETGEVKHLALDEYDIISYNSLINLINYEEPDFFTNEVVRDNTINILKQISSVRRLNHNIRDNIKETIQNLEPQKEKRLLKK